MAEPDPLAAWIKTCDLHQGYHYDDASHVTIGERAEELPRAPGDANGRVGLLIMRSYVLAGNTAHYDAMIGALEARGLRVITAFASGLDARPAMRPFRFSRFTHGSALVPGPVF